MKVGEFKYILDPTLAKRCVIDVQHTNALPVKKGNFTVVDLFDPSSELIFDEEVTKISIMNEQQIILEI